MRPDQATAQQRRGNVLPRAAISPTIIWRSLHARCAAAARWLGRQMEKRRSRVALLEMSDEQLKDIGLSRSDAHSEFRRRA
ncbi:DUF1127 domain-containing protein [Mesorhizobium comanense]|uniref:DUF1127 domain-containing protein n=1 Tax=Mesorhizobium comanense TaxID=2502215 RepID=UPI0010F4D55E|nr:DUF1127 domain-containing protein [Mesorhizobium comanense]